jgi:branched-chain amino acid transport system substrate-binding protein
MQGYGVKFNPPGNPMAGQNGRAFVAVYQVLDGELKHVYPPIIASVPNPPVLLPASSPFAAR